MKIGTVDSSGEALVSLAVEGPGSEAQQRDLVALLDTGFNGFLALPPALIDGLDLEQTSREQYVTASGAMHFTGVYEGVVVFGDQRLIVDEIVEAAEHPRSTSSLRSGRPWQVWGSSGNSRSASGTVPVEKSRLKNCKSGKRQGRTGGRSPLRFLLLDLGPHPGKAGPPRRGAPRGGGRLPVPKAFGIRVGEAPKAFGAHVPPLPRRLRPDDAGGALPQRLRPVRDVRWRSREGACGAGSEATECF